MARPKRDPVPRCETTGKHAWPTQAAALSSALRASKRAGGTPLRTYRCLKCGAWHLTSQPQRTERRAS